MLRMLTRTVAAATLLAVPLAACGGDSATGGGDVGSADLVVHAKDTLTFDKTEYSVHGGDITIGYIDDGSLQHTLLVDGHGPFKITVNSKESKTGTINLAPGSYTLYCDVPTHREAGMQAKLTVTEPLPSSSGAPSSASGN
jgi:plastocyanin